MKAESIAAIKKELNLIHPQALVNHCLRLAKFSTANKELLSYLLFSAGDDKMLIDASKSAIDDQFSGVGFSHTYKATTKGLRKGQSIIRKAARFSDDKRVEIELIIYYCSCFSHMRLSVRQHPVVGNIFMRELAKAEKLIASLHEDIQYDYKYAIEYLHQIEVG